MSNPDLTPTVITDVNGRVTTVHKRAPSQAPAASIPSPAASRSAKAKKPYSPDPAQRSKRTQHHIVWRHQMDERLANALNMPLPHGAMNVSTWASDVEAYEVLSVTSRDNAVLLLRNEILSKEDALTFLHSNGLDDLIEDNAAIMDGALRRRLSLSMFLSFYEHNKRSDPEVFVDAAESYCTKGIREKQSHPPIYELILNGEIALSDVKALTVKVLQAPWCGEATLDALRAIHGGNADYDAKALRRCIEDSCTYLTDGQMMKLVNTCGMATARNIKEKKRAYDIYVQAKDKYRHSFKMNDAILYSDIMGIYGRKADSAKDVLELFESGVEAGTAAKSLNEGMTIPQVIAISAQNAPASISSGWL